jgi:hypothetical protein
LLGNYKSKFIPICPYIVDFTEITVAMPTGHLWGSKQITSRRLVFSRRLCERR